MRDHGSGDALDSLIESLQADAEHPPKEVKGVSQDFLDELERVPRKVLKKEMDCPICGNGFLEGRLIFSESGKMEKWLMLQCQMSILSLSVYPAIHPTCSIWNA